MIVLKQVKPGMEPVPDVSLRFRHGPGEEWAEAKWIDILTHLRELPGPVPAEDQSSWFRRWGLLLVLAVLLSLVLLARKVNKLRGSPTPPLSPEQLALRELEHLEQTLQPPRGEAERYYTLLSETVRRYLVERFGFHALHQTTAEFLLALQQAPQRSASAKPDGSPLFSPEQEALLGDFFHRCDLAKFARVSTTQEECQRTAALARELIQQTASLQAIKASGIIVK